MSKKILTNFIKIFSKTPTNKARYTLVANNSEIGMKRRKNDVQRIVYKRRSPYFANRFFAVRCTQDLRWGSSLVDEHKVFFCRKKSSAAWKLTTNNEQCTATVSSHFRQQYFIRWKNNFFPYSSCSRIVYSGLKEYYGILLEKFDKMSGIWVFVITPLPPSQGYFLEGEKMNEVLFLTTI